LGARLIQIRIKDQPPNIVRAESRAARDTCERAGALLIVNDHWQLALDEGCSFVHLGQGDLDTADVVAIRAHGVRLGISTHDHAELDRARALKPDYIALGPIYPTVLKQMPWAPQGLERIGEWRKLVDGIPLVAIGGLTVERVPAAFEAGADIAAVGRTALRETLLPKVSLVTPNIPEAAILVGERVAADEQAILDHAERILRMGPAAVLIKGGHSASVACTDILVTAGQPPLRLALDRIPGTLRGTGCALAAAITTGLARGLPMAYACRFAKNYVGAELAAASRAASAA
jgi:thiamine-phosphate pyrophosphorylase